MANVSNVANYFLSKTIDEEDSKITNLKLQKLLYYAQGFHLALFEKELFAEEIEAWMHGPVSPDAYQLFKKFGANIIPCDECNEKFDEIFSQEQTELLDEVYDIFGQFSGWKLRNMTHEEPTWINNKDTANIISKDEMKEYFKTRVA